MKVQNNFESKVFAYIEKNEMIKPGDNVVLGVSGGADSVCLFFLLMQYRRWVPFQAFVVHVNHGIREDAGEDEQFVEKLCSREGVPVITFHENVKAFAAENKLSEEDAGRQLRYKHFEEVAAKLGGAKIAVAHNANDRAETMLLHLFRGSGLRGLSGMEAVRDNIIRPLLSTEREEIEAYLTEQGMSWQTDATNQTDDYTRNKVRHHILAYAKEEISEKVVQQLCAAGDRLAEAEDFLRRQTDAVWERTVSRDGTDCICIDLASFLQEDILLQKRVLLQAAETLSPTGKDITAGHIAELQKLLLSQGTATIDLPYGIVFRKQYDRLIGEIRKPGEEPAVDEGDMPAFDMRDFVVQGDITLPGEKTYTKWFDYDKIEGPLVIRYRRIGDYLTIADGKGGTVHKSLKDYMITEKIPKEERDRIPLVADGQHILWVVGYRISEYYKVTEETTRILEIKKQNCSEQ